MCNKIRCQRITKAIAKEYDKNKIRFYIVNPNLTATPMTNLQGVNPKKVAEVTINTAKENLRKDSGEDIDVDDYV